jgi:hypothetical protein
MFVSTEEEIRFNARRLLFPQSEYLKKRARGDI